MDFSQELKNYQTLGTKETLALLAAEEKQLKMKQMLVSIVGAVAELSKLIYSQELSEDFNNYQIKKMRVQLTGPENEENYIFFTLRDSKDKKIELYNSENKLILPYRKINSILCGIIWTQKPVATAQEEDFEFTDIGLQSLQRFLLGPNLYIILEKTMLNKKISSSFDKEKIIPKI